jgi:hypothetical protein
VLEAFPVEEENDVQSGDVPETNGDETAANVTLIGPLAVVALTPYWVGLTEVILLAS